MVDSDLPEQQDSEEEEGEEEYSELATVELSDGGKSEKCRKATRSDISGTTHVFSYGFCPVVEIFFVLMMARTVLRLADLHTELTPSHSTQTVTPVYL